MDRAIIDLYAPVTAMARLHEAGFPPHVLTRILRTNIGRLLGGM